MNKLMNVLRALVYEIFLYKNKKVINFFDGFLYWVLLMYVLGTY